MKVTKRWNPKYLLGCVRLTLELLGTGGPAVDLLREAVEHLVCVEKYDCRYYRSQLKRGVSRLRRSRRIVPWEHWLFEAADRILQPVPGVKHQAVTMLQAAVTEYDCVVDGSNADLRTTWRNRVERLESDEPAYL
jgi:hypothetical protein